jgi:hypothetical protein
MTHHLAGAFRFGLPRLFFAEVEAVVAVDFGALIGFCSLPNVTSCQRSSSRTLAYSTAARMGGLSER